MMILVIKDVMNVRMVVVFFQHSVNMLSSFSTSEPVDIFIASPSPVVFTVYEVGKAYEVCTYL